MATIQLPTLLGTGNKWQQQVKWPLYFLRPLVSVVSLGATQTEMDNSTTHLHHHKASKPIPTAPGVPKYYIIHVLSRHNVA